MKVGNRMWVIKTVFFFSEPLGGGWGGFSPISFKLPYPEYPLPLQKKKQQQILFVFWMFFTFSLPTKAISCPKLYTFLEKKQTCIKMLKQTIRLIIQNTYKANWIILGKPKFDWSKLDWLDCLLGNRSQDILNNINKKLHSYIYHMKVKMLWAVQQMNCFEP